MEGEKSNNSKFREQFSCYDATANKPQIRSALGVWILQQINFVDANSWAAIQSILRRMSTKRNMYTKENTTSTKESERERDEEEMNIEMSAIV